MSKIWSTPRQWNVAEPVTSLKMRDISNGMDWLFQRPRNIVKYRGTSASIALSTTVWAAILDANLTLQLTTATNNEDVFLSFSGVFSLAAVANNAIFLDWLVNDSVYVSSGSGTPSSGGCKALYNTGGSGALQQFQLIQHYTVPTAGLHTFKLRTLGSAANTVTYYSTSSLSLDHMVLDI